MKFLILNQQGIGDIVHMLPMIENIRLAHPASKITIIYKDDSYKCLFRDGLIDEYIVFRNIDKETIWRVRREKYDYGISNVITNAYKSAVFLRIMGCHKIVAEGKYPVFNKKLLFSDRVSINRVDRNNDLMRLINIPIVNTVPEIRLYNKLSSSHTIALCMGSAKTVARVGFRKIQKNVKQWPVNNIKRLVEMLTDDGYKVILLGGDSERYISKCIEGLDTDLINDYIGKTTLIESIVLMNGCGYVIGVDTGLIHVAEALGKKTISIYGPTLPREFYIDNGLSLYIQPRNGECANCYKTRRFIECDDNTCMQSISAEEVYDRLKEVSD